MKLQRSTLGIVINFLLGVAWAFVLIGAFYTFSSFYKYNISDAILMTFFGVLPGLFLVVILEYIFIAMERLREMKKQTALLEQLTTQNQTIINLSHSKESSRQ